MVHFRTSRVACTNAHSAVDTKILRIKLHFHYSYMKSVRGKLLLRIVNPTCEYLAGLCKNGGYMMLLTGN